MTFDLHICIGCVDITLMKPVLYPLYISATVTLKVTFEVCQEMRKHMEIFPKNGFIQAQSTLNAQLKFQPR